MKKTMTRKQVHDVYAVIGNARLTDLKKTEDKIAVLKVLRELRYVAVKYEEDAKEANEKLKPSGYDDRFGQAVAYERKQKTTMTRDEYLRFVTENNEYQQAIQDAMRDVDTATLELEFEPVDTCILEQLMATNGWTVEQYFRIEEVLSESPI